MHLTSGLSQLQTNFLKTTTLQHLGLLGTEHAPSPEKSKIQVLHKDFILKTVISQVIKSEWPINSPKTLLKQQCCRRQEII